MDKETQRTQNIADKSIAQAGALAVHDAANNMRDTNTLLSTALGVTMANYIESGDPKYLEAIKTLKQQSRESKQDFIDLYNSVTQTSG